MRFDERDHNAQDRADKRLGCAIFVICVTVLGLFAWKFFGGLPDQASSANGQISVVGTAPDLESVGRDERIQEYFKEGNEVGRRLGLSNLTRNVPKKLRDAIIARDGEACIICGETQALDVDHTQALENGGDNSPANLATLCPNCHRIKGLHDKSLRRQRQKQQRALR